MSQYPLIRAIYLYLFALLGLVLLTIGGVRFVDMGLKAFVFTKAEDDQRFTYQEMPMAPIKIDNLQKSNGEQVCLSQEEKAAFDQYLADYKKQQEQRAKIDYVTSQRHRDASLNLALILIGLPLYLYHWGVIRKETKKV